MMLFIFVIAACENEQEPIPGKLIVTDKKHTDCKSFKSFTSPKQDCVEYRTIDSNYLKINRVNVAFNCCIDDVNIKSSVDQNNIITILETEVCSSPCDCNCLYDLEYTIGPLEYKVYTLRIIEEYADTMVIEFEFSQSTEGEYCEERNSYPWDVK